MYCEKFDKLLPFIRELDALKCGVVTREKIGSILDSDEKAFQLALELAVVKDLKSIVSTTYELDSDGLEFLLLVYHRAEVVCALGRGNTSGALCGIPYVDLR